MASVNKVILIGNLGRDPEVRYSPSGAAVCNITIATSRQWKNKETGERQEETEWSRVVMYDRLAEVAGEYLKKGKSVYIEGRLKTRKWADKEGVERYTTEIIAQEMTMLGGKDSGDAPAQEKPRQPASTSNSYAAAKDGRAPQKASGTGFDDMDDDIPF